MKFLAAIGALAIVIAVGAAVFFFFGFYNVAGTYDNLTVVNWALGYIRNSSIERRATAQPPTNFSDQTNVQAGARQFLERGCANCHGAPGVKWAKFSEGLSPGPPDLKDIVNDLSPQHLFWVIKNGIDMTGMPSFARAGVSDDQLWTIVAFLKKLPSVSDADFKSWTSEPATTPKQ